MTLRISLLLCSCLALTNCVAVAGGAALGAVAGVAAAQDGGLQRVVSDAGIQTTINDLWFRHNTEIFRKLDLTVKQGRVLITGVVQNPEHRVDAVRLAWKAEGVKQVINEIKVAKSPGFTGYMSDTWILTQLRSGIIFDPKVQSINYNIDVVDGTVYFMGTAASRKELNRATERARTIRGVKQVVSYMKIAGQNEAGDIAGERLAPITATGAPVSQPSYQDNSYSNSVDPNMGGSFGVPAVQAPISLEPPPEDSAYGSGYSDESGSDSSSGGMYGSGPGTVTAEPLPLY